MSKNKTDPVSVYINHGNPLPASIYIKKHNMFSIKKITP